LHVFIDLIKDKSMSKGVILFGSEGSLGSQLKNILINENEFQKLIFIDRKLKDENISSTKNITQIFLNDIFEKDNFNNLKLKILSSLKQNSGDKEKINLLMISTIGGYIGGKKFWEYDICDWKNIFEKNFFVNICIAKLIIDLSEDLDFSEIGIVFITSYLTKKIEKDKSLYLISKKALNKLIEISYVEIEHKNIYLSGIAPYLLDTKQNREWIEDEKKLITAMQIYEIIKIFYKNKHKYAGEIFYIK